MKMKNIDIKSLIIVILVLINIAVLFKKSNPRLQVTDNPSTSSRDQKVNTLAVKNRSGSVSTLERTDLNSDGVDEIIFRPKAMSWSEGTYILDDNMEPFCKKCTFP